MEVEITNLEQLRAKITLLKIRKAEDEIFFHQKYQSIKNKITHPLDFLKELVFGNGHANNHQKADWVTSIGRIFLPFFLNKTILRNRGIFVKTIASLFSQKVVSSDILNKNTIAHWIDAVTGFIKTKTKKEKRYGADDYGIPPESETA